MTVAATGAQPAVDGNDMDHYADDLATVINTLDLHDVTLVGSTGGGEVARYIGRHGTGRVKKAVLISSVPPFMLKTADNPNGLPIEVFDGIRKAQMDNRAQLYRDIRRARSMASTAPVRRCRRG
jgi:non-heme chloroperoxidase